MAGPSRKIAFCFSAGFWTYGPGSPASNGRGAAPFAVPHDRVVIRGYAPASGIWWHGPPRVEPGERKRCWELFEPRGITSRVSGAPLQSSQFPLLTIALAKSTHTRCGFTVVALTFFGVLFENAIEFPAQLLAALPSRTPRSRAGRRAHPSARNISSAQFSKSWPNFRRRSALTLIYYFVDLKNWGILMCPVKPVVPSELPTASGLCPTPVGISPAPALTWPAGRDYPDSRLVARPTRPSGVPRIWLPLIGGPTTPDLSPWPAAPTLTSFVGAGFGNHGGGGDVAPLLMGIGIAAHACPGPVPVRVRRCVNLHVRESTGLRPGAENLRPIAGLWNVSMRTVPGHHGGDSHQAKKTQRVSTVHLPRRFQPGVGNHPPAGPSQTEAG